MSLTKPKAKTTPKMNVSEYLQSRIDAANTAGFTSTKIWIRNDTSKEALKLLSENDFKFSVIAGDEKSKQYEVSWD